MRMKNKMNSFLRNCIFVFFSIGVFHVEAWEGEYWSQMTLTNFDKDAYRIYSAAEVRVDRNFTQIYFIRLSECFVYRLLDNLDTEAHYSFIYRKAPGIPNYEVINRLEFEINPRFDLGEGVKLLSRNRLELVKPQNSSIYRQVLRHRLLIGFPIENWGNLITISCSDEVFYHCNQHKFTQNRFIPLQMTFQLETKVTVDLFFMIRNFFSTAEDKWLNSLVFGSQVTF